MPTQSGSRPVYDLHEWGLVSAGPSAFEVAAGPGQRPMAIAVDKPVLYVHPGSADPFELGVRVDLGSGLEVAEHFPPVAALAPIVWQVRVGGRCRGSYPAADDSRCPDGYCEIGELSHYETTDAACLDVNGVRAPLLFYRLRATAEPPPLPIEILSSGNGKTAARNRSLGARVGGAWRITWDGSATRASRVELPGVGETLELPTAAGSPTPARRAIRADLATLGLTGQEVRVFMDAWDTALFGIGPALDGDDGVPRPTDQPVDRVGASDETDILTDDMPVSPAPRVRDALLYWLPAGAIDDLARVTAEPAPRHFRRAFLVRQAL